MTETTSYVPYSDDVEQPAPDEDEVIARIVASMHETRELTFERHQHGVRDAHAKSHGLLTGELTVRPDLPDHLRQGLFAREATYPVVVRLSSAQPDIRSDQTGALRGFALKVLGVEGPRALPDDEGPNQDFLLVTFPVFPPADVTGYLAGQLAGHELVRRPEGPAPAEIPGAPATHMLGETFHSMAALRFGDHMAKISAAPLSDSVRALTGRPVDPELGPGAMRTLAADFFRHNSAAYELRAQLCTDLAAMPIEDASVAWPEALSPHQPVATLSFPAQELLSEARRVYADDVLSFNPWHALAAHRPLGSANRSRRRAYEASSAFRHTKNLAPRVEPRTLADLPD